MLNYIAILLVQYVARGPLPQPGGYLPESAQFVQAPRMPVLLGNRIHLGVFLALLFIPIVYALLWSTPLGFRLRAWLAGQCGALCGHQRGKDHPVCPYAFQRCTGRDSGHHRGEHAPHTAEGRHLRRLRVQRHPGGAAGPDASGGRGGQALFFAALTIGAQTMHVVYGLPDALATAIQAIVVLCVLAADTLVHRR